MSDKTTKFTPAPWEQNGINAVHSKDGNCISITHREGFKKVDAVLIAQAPAMYSSIEELISIAAPTDSEELAILIRAKSILAAARGETVNQPQG